MQTRLSRFEPHPLGREFEVNAASILADLPALSRALERSIATSRLDGLPRYAYIATCHGFAHNEAHMHAGLQTALAKSVYEQLITTVGADCLLEHLEADRYLIVPSESFTVKEAVLFARSILRHYLQPLSYGGVPYPTRLALGATQLVAEAASPAEVLRYGWAAQAAQHALGGGSFGFSDPHTGRLAVKGMRARDAIVHSVSRGTASLWTSGTEDGAVSLRNFDSTPTGSWNVLRHDEAYLADLPAPSAWLERGGRNLLVPVRASRLADTTQVTRLLVDFLGSAGKTALLMPVGPVYGTAQSGLRRLNASGVRLALRVGPEADLGRIRSLRPAFAICDPKEAWLADATVAASPSTLVCCDPAVAQWVEAMSHG